MRTTCALSHVAQSLALVSGLFGEYALAGSNNQKGNDVDGKTFDYVIVGGGTSGLVVANRLTEDRRSRLRLITCLVSIRHNKLTPQPSSYCPRH